MTKAPWITGLLALLASACTDRPPGHVTLSHEDGRQPPEVHAPSEVLDTNTVLSWLPPDTVSVAVARGPFAMPRSPLPPADPTGDVLTEDDLRGMFERLPLSLFTLEQGKLLEHIAGAEVLVAVQGIARFRQPKSLGEGPFDGCSIAAFRTSVGAGGFIHAAPTRREIGGVTIAEFTEKLEQDEWHMLVGFPSPHTALVCTDGVYMAAVIGRMQRRAPEPRFAPEAPQWLRVDEKAPFWGFHVGGGTFTIRDAGMTRITVTYEGSAEPLDPQQMTALDARRGARTDIHDESYSLRASPELEMTLVLHLELILGHVIFI